jgi:hypothetical protein
MKQLQLQLQLPNQPKDTLQQISNELSIINARKSSSKKEFYLSAKKLLAVTLVPSKSSIRSYTA